MCKAEFALLIKFSIVTDHCLFQCPKCKRASIGIENFQRSRESGPIMVGPGKDFQNRSSHMARKRFVESGFCKIQRHFTNPLSSIYRKCVKYPSVSRVCQGPTVVGP